MHDKLGPIGLTKREHFAALILAGLWSNSDVPLDLPEGAMAKMAIDEADRLIEALAIQDEAPIDPDDLAMDELRAEYYSSETLLVQVGDA